MEIADLARLRGIYQSLSLAQRTQLRAIAQCGNQPVNAPVCQSLIDLELIRLDAHEYWNKYVATEDGRYVASLS